MSMQPFLRKLSHFATKPQPPLVFALFAAIAYRFAFPFIDSPLSHLFSDPNRHWLNGKRFFTPDLMGSIDPFLYQLWVHLVQTIAQDNRWVIEGFSGLLCALVPWLWYKALRELLPRTPAMLGALAIALMPSLLGTYDLFMTETLLLPLMAGATWMTLRAFRKRDFLSFFWAALLWTLACYTRMIALPVAGGCLGLLWLQSRLRISYALAAALLFLAVGIPAAWHSHLQLNYYAPFGADYPNRIYRASANKIYEMHVERGGRYGFSSPVFYNPIFEPLAHWKSPRDGTFVIKVDLQNGRADWQREYERALLTPRPFTDIDDFIDNAVATFFATSWPDDNPALLWGWLTIQSRWLIAPMTLAVAALFFTVRLPRRQALIPLIGLGLMLLLLVQQSAVMEGRYRKPAEPYLIAALVLYGWRMRKCRPLALPAPEAPRLESTV